MSTPTTTPTLRDASSTAPEAEGVAPEGTTSEAGAPEAPAAEATVSETTTSETTTSDATAADTTSSWVQRTSALRPRALRLLRRPAGSTRPSLLARIVSSVWPLVAAAAGAIGFWYLVSYVVLPEGRRFLLPPPHQVFTESVLDWSKVQPMLDALTLTAQVALTGLGIAVVLGITQAVVMSQAGWVEKFLYPYAVVLQTIPVLALVPLIGLWFGFGFTSRVIVCVIIALFPMISNTLFGLQSADAAAHDLFTLNKATRAQRLWKLQMPAAVPSIFAGLKISAGLAVIGAIVGDMFFRQGAPGIGSLLDVYRARVESENLLTAIGIASLFGVAVFAFFTVIDKAVMARWYGVRR